MAGQPPTGTATVVLGDVAGSTRLWQEQRTAMAASSRRLAVLLDELVARHDGHRPREQGEGDNVVATFAVAADAVAFAVALDQALASEPWPEGLRIGMRIGLHTGDVVWDEAVGYLGPTFNRCARLRDLGRARMILLSQTTRDVVADGLPDGAVLVDLGEHQLRDLSRRERVHQLRHPGSPERFAPLKSVTVLPNNLPVPVTTLVGRDVEIAEVVAHFGDHRLVTLTGAGGSGKTRLSQHVASELLRFAPDGVWWVDLMPVVDDQRVPVAIAESIGIDDVTPSSRADEVVAAGIGERRMLLVLDNCEHLIDAAADVVDLLLQRCPSLRVLATSREALDVPGERAVRVRPLGLPDEDVPSLASLEANPATSLFLDRATALDRDGLDAAQRRSIAQVCRRLDGMPLAIELAAARARVLAVGEIEAGLDDRFGLLRSRRRGRRGRSVARQRTLEASIAWSFDLLDDEESAMLCRLAVFPAAFDLDGAHAVGWPADRTVALDLLSALVDKSLVAVRPAGDGRRYRLLESIRHYALVRLQDHGHGEEAQLAHLRHTIDRVTALAESDGRVFGAIGPISTIPPSLQDDMLAADATAVEAGLHADLVDLYWPMYFTLMFRGTYHAALPSLLEVLDGVDALDTSRRARAYSLALAFLTSANRQDEVVPHAEAAIAAGYALEEEQGDVAVVSSILGTVAFAAAFGGTGGAAGYARAEMKHIREIVLEHGDPWMVGSAAPYCALSLAFGGDDAAGWELAQEAVQAADDAGLAHLAGLAAIHRNTIAQRVGLPAAELHELMDDAVRRIPADTPRLHAQLSSVGWWLGLLTGSVDVTEQWVAHGQAHAGPPGSGSYALANIGDVVAAYVRGDLDRAVDLAEVAVADIARTDNRWWQTHARTLLVMAKVARGDGDAPDAIAGARALLPAGEWPILTSWLDASEARHLLAVGDAGAAATLVTDVAGRQRRTGGQLLWMVLSLAAGVFATFDRPEDAATALAASDRLLGELGYADQHPAVATAARATARRGLGDADLARALARGAGMTDGELEDWLAPSDDGKRVDRPVAGWDALTPAELDVARKVADGLTNRAVGDALFVSENTVKTHLKSVYAKLDISSRAELAAQVAVSDGRAS